MSAFDSLYHLHRLKKRLFWSESKLENLRKKKLTGLLNYCYENIPYYHQQFRKIGAEPKDFREPQDLIHFPILEKETLRDRSEEFINPKANRSAWIQYRSSGSTGIPLELWYHPQERLRMGHTVTRELLFNGLKPWYRMVNITEPRHSASKNRWYHRLGVMNERFLSVYEHSDLNLQELRNINPHLIIGFPSVLMVIGQEMRNHGGKPIRPKLLFTLAEVLTERDREILKDQWGVQPIDLYGANEVGHIAFQCWERGGYHINIDSLHVEILADGKPASPGERGEVVVTNFDLRAMPIIRYRVGDIAQFISGKCFCGCQYPRLGKIAGRSDGFIVGADKTPYSALEISLLLKPVKGIKQFRLIQEKLGELLVEWISSDAELNPEMELKKILQERLGANMVIQMRQIAEIPREKSGKIRSVISKLPHPFWQNATEG